MQTIEPEYEETEYMEEFSEEPLYDPLDSEFDDMADSRVMLAMEIVNATRRT